MTYTNSLGEVIQVGSIITAYRPGYHVVTDIEDRSARLSLGVPMTPLIHYKPLLTSTGKPARKSKEACDSSYCRLASGVIPEHIKELEAHILALKQFQSDYDC